MVEKVVLIIEDNEIVAAEDEHGNRLKHFSFFIDELDDVVDDVNDAQKATLQNPSKMEKTDSDCVKAMAGKKCCGWSCIEINGDEFWICIKWC